MTDIHIERPPTSGTTTSVLGQPRGNRTRWLILAGLVATIWYFGWLLQPGRIGNPWLYGALLVAEVFNIAQAIGFWWTLSRDRNPTRTDLVGHYATVDVLVPRYNEPVEVVEPVLKASLAMIGADVTVHLLDDGDSPEMEALADRLGVRYVTRTEHNGAKAGNINAALPGLTGEFVAIFDCDHVPHPQFLRRTLGPMRDDRVGFVQTPQYYANADRNPIAAVAWSQQALFFGCIGRGKNAMGAMFCCGTNVLFRRAALDDIGGFPEDSITEDFQLSIHMHERGWKSDYVAEVLVHGLGPEDMAAYVGQQLRWARGCLSAMGRALRARLPLRHKVQYLLSSSYFLTGWTALVYMSLPIIRIATGEQPLASATAGSFLIHFAPYFLCCIAAVAMGSAGTFTFNAFAMAVACFWIHIVASIQVLLRRKGRFVVTPKVGAGSWQPLSVWPTLLMIGVLVTSVGYGLVQSREASMLNNVAFALLHVVVLSVGVSWALRVTSVSRAASRGLPDGEARWGSPDATPCDDSGEIKRLICAP